MTRSKTWTFLTNHAIVLLQVSTNSHLTVREIADRIGITERAVQRILADLEETGYLVRRRVGRRTQYSVSPDRPFRHPTMSHLDIEGLLKLFEPARRRW